MCLDFDCGSIFVVARGIFDMNARTLRQLIQLIQYTLLLQLLLIHITDGLSVCLCQDERLCNRRAATKTIEDDEREAVHVERASVDWLLKLV